MARIYTNENFYRAASDLLRTLGHDVLTTFEAGNANQGIPDEAVLEFAKSENRIIVTLNRKHFIRLHHLYPIHAGIIVCTEDKDLEGLASRIHEAIVSANENLENQLIRVYRPNLDKK